MQKQDDSFWDTGLSARLGDRWRVSIKNEKASSQKEGVLSILKGALFALKQVAFLRSHYIDAGMAQWAVK